MKINDLIKFARDKNLGRKGLKKRVRDLKKSDYGKNWQVVDEEWPHESGSFFQDLFDNSYTCTAQIS